MPQLELNSHGIEDAAKQAVLGLLSFVEHLAAAPDLREHAVEVIERSLIMKSRPLGSKYFVSAANVLQTAYVRPRAGSLLSCAAPALDVDAQYVPIPGAQYRRIACFHEDAADAQDACHAATLPNALTPPAP